MLLKFSDWLNLGHVSIPAPRGRVNSRATGIENLGGGAAAETEVLLPEGGMDIGLVPTGERELETQGLLLPLV